MLKYQLRTLSAVLLVTVVGAVALGAQQPPPGGGRPGAGPGPRPGDGNQPPPRPGGPMAPNRPPIERMFGAVPQGRWWTDPGIVQRLVLTPEQQKQIETQFQASRLKLIDLNASLQKEEVVLEPLLDADRPDEAKILPQIDRVAQARAELEKANARMLLGFRGVLNQEQWKNLQTNGRPGPPPPRNNGR